MDWKHFFLKRDSIFFVSLLHPFLRRDVRRDEKFGLVLAELIFVDVISETVEELGRNEEPVDDEFLRRREEEGSSHREEDWRRMSLRRRSGSSRRRADTLVSWKRCSDMYITNRSWWNTYGCHESSIRATRFMGIFHSSSDLILALEPWETTSKRAQIEWADRFRWQPQEATRIPFTELSPDRRCPI